MNLKICSTKNFKKGDTLWFCNFELQPSGRAKNNIKPRSIKVTKVYQDRIEVDMVMDYGVYLEFIILIQMIKILVLEIGIIMLV